MLTVGQESKEEIPVYPLIDAGVLFLKAGTRGNKIL
jgi:hypothetical protein